MEFGKFSKVLLFFGLLFEGWLFYMDRIAAILFLGMSTVAVIAILAWLMAHPVPITSGGTGRGRGGKPVEKGFGSQFLKGDLGDPAEPDPPAEPVAPETPPKPEENSNQRTFYVAIDANTAEASRFRKIFGDRLGIWSRWQMAKERDKASIVIHIKFQRFLERNSIENRVKFEYEGRLVQKAEVFCRSEATLKLVSYENDDGKLFEAAANKIADKLIRDFPNYFD